MSVFVWKYKKKSFFLWQCHCFSIQKLLGPARPHHTCRFLSENEYPPHPTPVWPTVHTYLVETVTENGSFQKRTQEWRFLKTSAFRLRGRTKTEVFEYDDVTHHITSSMTYVPWGMLSCRSSLLGASKSYTRPMSRHFYGLFIFRHILWVPDFHRFSVFMWTSETIRLRCVTMGIFLNTEKTSPFSKNMRILVDGALVIKLCLLLPRPRVIRCQDHLPPTKIWNCFRNLNSLHIK